MRRKIKCDLLLDEADALFGKRSQVKDSRDCYANRALDYLCERLENFQGPIILACNRRHHALEAAFTRKIQCHLWFRESPCAHWRSEIADKSICRDNDHAPKRLSCGSVG